MAGERRTPRDRRRRALGQNFLRPETAARLVAWANIRATDLVLDIGAGAGSLTRALAATGASVLAIELDHRWMSRLETLANRYPNVRLIHEDFRRLALPQRPFRVFSSPPFAATTDLLHFLLDTLTSSLTRADLVLQAEVASKRAHLPPTTLNSTLWAPWWSFELGPRIPRTDFRPVPRVDAAMLTITRRNPPILPPRIASTYADFLRAGWPFEQRRARSR